MIIDAHVHLWDKQNGILNNTPVFSLGNGKSMFGGNIMQMMPPYMIKGHNNYQMLLSNMDYALVNGAVITQEYIDGNQDDYLLKAKANTNGRLKICSLYSDIEQLMPEGLRTKGFDGIKICGSRLSDTDLTKHIEVFKTADKNSMFVAIDMADGEIQTGQLEEIIHEFPNLRITIGHFGMAGVEGWESQIALARHPNVRIESGGITWLYHYNYYPYPEAIKAIKKAIDICGVEKLMWGSDYPRTMTAITYLQSLDFVQKSTELTDYEKSAFLGDNAYRFYGFSDLSPLKRIKNMVE